MNYIKVILFIVLFLIVGLAYANQDWNGLEGVHPYIGYLLLVSYISGSALFVYKPLKGDRKLKRHFFIRFFVVCIAFLLLLAPYLILKQQNDGLGAGYLLYFMTVSLAVPLSIYAFIEIIWLFTQKKYPQIGVNLLLVGYIYCLFLFSGLFGY
jgi:branched-subunit amino acid transport protein AzlD